MYPARGRGSVRVHVSVGTLAGNVSFNVPIIYLLIRQKEKKKKKETNLGEFTCPRQLTWGDNR